jgi:hypothetical protein
MKIRMLSPGVGSPDGINVICYKAGEKYDLPGPLANMFIGMGKAEEDKDMGGPPEVKAENDYDWPWGNEATATLTPVKKAKKKRK